MKLTPIDVLTEAFSKDPPPVIGQTGNPNVITLTFTPEPNGLSETAAALVMMSLGFDIVRKEG